MPALLTRPCSPPNLYAVFTAVAQSLSCVTSCRTKTAEGPSSDASWRPSASSTSPMTIRAASATNQHASAAPCPRAPPLMSIVFPLRRSILRLHLVFPGCVPATPTAATKAAHLDSSGDVPRADQPCRADRHRGTGMPRRPAAAYLPYGRDGRRCLAAQDAADKVDEYCGAWGSRR